MSVQLLPFQVNPGSQLQLKDPKVSVQLEPAGHGFSNVHSSISEEDKLLKFSTFPKQEIHFLFISLFKK